MPKIRVLVVDDAVVMRRMITEALAKDSELEIVGTAANGRIALQKIPQVNPDLITLDVEMPDMDGLTTVREIRKSHPRLPVIMFSTATQKGATTTLEALGAGATDYVTKPANVGSISEGLKRLESELIPKIKAHCGKLASRGSLFGPAAPRLRTVTPAVRQPVEVVCIGASTGGPNALATVLSGLPATFHLPVLIVQHMPPVFTQALAERFNSLGPLHCVEAIDGQVIEPGCVYIAPGGKHMEVKRDTNGRRRIATHEGPPENSCRPAVDVLFRSIAEHYGATTLAVVLTGMGQDGLRGCRNIHEKHGNIVVQDEVSSVVWGMPGHVAHDGIADAIVPLDQVSLEITRRIRQTPSALPTGVVTCR